jgi:uncharacterized protein (TIGR02001 family)
MIRALFDYLGSHALLKPLFFTPIAACLFSAPALADLDFNAGATSTYVREGISQTRGNPTVQSGLTFKHNTGLYAGVWASGIDRSYDHAYMEADGFAGWYLPFSENYALDLSGAHYRFYGGRSATKQDYSEGALSVLLYDTVKLGYRYSEDYMGLDKPWQAISGSYNLRTQGFDMEFYLANYRFRETDGSIGASYSTGERNDYWHYRIGVERTWNKWDYRLSVERTNLNSNYDAGTLFQFSMRRHFKVW